MEIYTSYFGRLSKLTKAGIVPIAISIYPPKWFKGNAYFPFAPLRPMLKMEVEDYVPAFNSQVLSKVDPQKALRSLQQLSEGQDCALLCYELPTDFCHRQLVGKWLNQQLELNVREWQPETPIKQKVTDTQASLFDAFGN